MNGLTIDVITAREVDGRIGELSALLDDAIRGGASVGFVLPLAQGECEAYWREIALDVADGMRDVLVAKEHGRVVGTVQLAPSGKTNQPHRADVQKLLVLASARGHGVGAALMRALEARARAAGRWLLTLDTRTDSVAERCYRRWGWTACGTIPDYAKDPDGTFANCTFFYKALDARERTTA